jgi:hypothetical protein
LTFDQLGESTLPKPLSPFVSPDDEPKLVLRIGGVKEIGTGEAHEEAR